MLDDNDDGQPLPPYKAQFLQSGVDYWPAGPSERERYRLRLRERIIQWDDEALFPSNVRSVLGWAWAPLIPYRIRVTRLKDQSGDFSVCLPCGDRFSTAVLSVGLVVHYV